MLFVAVSASFFCKRRVNFGTKMARPSMSLPGRAFAGMARHGDVGLRPPPCRLDNYTGAVVERGHPMRSKIPFASCPAQNTQPRTAAGTPSRGIRISCEL